MKRDELKARVTAAINETWLCFQREHPAFEQAFSVLLSRFVGMVLSQLR